MLDNLQLNEPILSLKEPGLGLLLLFSSIQFIIYLLVLFAIELKLYNYIKNSLMSLKNEIIRPVENEINDESVPEEVKKSLIIMIIVK